MSFISEYRHQWIFLFVFSLILAAGCSNKTTKNNHEVYRILHNREIAKIDTASQGLAKYQIKPGNNIVFSYNKILSKIKKDTVINNSESIVFQIPSNVKRFDYKGVSLDSTHAFYMTSAANLKQYPISGGEIKGHELQNKKWQVELTINVKVNGVTKSRHIKHKFSALAYGEDNG